MKWVYLCFGKLGARINGVEKYAKIISIKSAYALPGKSRLPAKIITVVFYVNNEKIIATATSSDISYFDMDKVKVNTQIRIKYLPMNPQCIYISEFSYANRGIFDE